MGEHLLFPVVENQGQYFCEGILPFMNIFFKEFGSQITSLEVNQKMVAASVYPALKIHAN